VNGYLVDTNIPSELTRETPDARVAAFLRGAGQESVFLSVMTVGEICKGLELLPVSPRRKTLQGWFDIDVRSWFAGTNSPCRRIHRGTLAPFSRNRETTRVRVGGRGWHHRRHGS
jgi:hypothetical protein